VSEPSQTISQLLMMEGWLPSSISNQVFQGYRAVSISKVIEKIPTNTAKAAYNLMVGTSIGDEATCLRFRSHPVCGRPGMLDIVTEKEPVPAEYRDVAADLTAKKLKIRDTLPKAYDERVVAVIDVLANAFRSVDFVPHTDWEDLPKTAAVLRGSGLGDCKDFALSRYILARQLGVKPQHIFVACYLREKDTGHANLALYNPARQVWTVVEGTGRNQKDGEQLGQTYYYENNKASWDVVKPLLPSYIPVMAVSDGKIWGFDSMERYNPKTGERTAKKPEPVPAVHPEVLFKMNAPIMIQG